MPLWKIAGAFCVGLLCAIPALAQEKDPFADVLPENILTLKDGSRVDCTDGGDTSFAMNMCASAELEKLEEKMDRYWQAARQRFSDGSVDSAYNKDSDEEKTAALARFDAAQAEWKSYSTSHCQSVYYEWEDGTIRGQMYLGCKIAMTQKRTWEIWSTWLTYADSTPALLPEPDFGYYPRRDDSSQ